MSHWEAHPHVRTGSQLTLGERAADGLKRWFGTWAALGGVAAAIAVWTVAQATPWHWDPYPYILLNLCLSCLAAVQGIVLQIAANRGDRIASEVATGTHKMAEDLLDLNQEILNINQNQSRILAELRALRADTGDTRSLEGGAASDG